MSEQEPKLSRRDLLKAATIGGFGLTTLGNSSASSIEEYETSNISLQKQKTMIGVQFEPRDLVRVGIVGVGLRGTEVLGEFLAIDKVVINAVCDVVKEKCQRAAQMVEKAGQKAPAIYADGETAFEKLSKRDDLDFIYIATPWEWHTPQILAALKEGKHVGTEVPAAYTLEDCWNIVGASEKA
ncbi:MAG TPA: Gfo/Idh/MocA family oxidoreductase, partial [Pyrinomonadaceae bacterium]